MVTDVRQTVRNGFSPAVRKMIRHAADAAGSTCPVVVAGDKAPELMGTGWQYTTKSGIPIHHPSAYSRLGWSNMVYHPSTRRIEVGIEWVALAN